MFSGSVHERSCHLQDLVGNFVSQLQRLNEHELEEDCRNNYSSVGVLSSMLDMVTMMVNDMNDILSDVIQQEQVTVSQSELSESQVEDSDIGFELGLEEELRNEFLHYLEFVSINSFSKKTKRE
eukprot:XP_014774055.1 PREDICTED: uncharacterized protein LOC106871850 isoform X2 [Octopus bimaculoides]